MTEKPKIQYIREFYNYGSEAPKLDIRNFRLPKTTLPLERLRKAESITVDPVAILAIVAALLLLAAMAVGIMQIQDDWAAYEAMDSHLSSLNAENARLELEYRESFDIDEIRSKAVGLGLVPEAEVTTMTVTVTVPEAPHVETWQERLVWFWKGLWA